MKPAVLITIIVLLAATLGLVIFYSKSNASPSTTSNQPAAVNASPTSTSGVTDPADVASAHKVVLKTDKGDIALDLYPENTPLAVKNFVTLGKRGYYDGIIFHRVIKNFVIQGGDPTGTGTGGESIYGKAFPDETNTAHTYQQGSLGMANSGANTNGSQFYIVTGYATADNISALTPQKYTLFGQVADQASMDVVNAIASVSTDPSTDKPLADVKITGFDIVTP